jgi:RimJ/RimL family protein N-acetyltransferase
MKKTLVFGKIRLRPLEPEDIDILYEWENNMEIWEAGNTKTPFSRYILAQYIKESGKDIYEQKQLRLIIQTETGEPVGAVDLFDFDPYHLRAGSDPYSSKKPVEPGICFRCAGSFIGICADGFGAETNLCRNCRR